MVQMTAQVLQFPKQQGTPFATPEEAWFATMRFLKARAAGDAAAQRLETARFNGHEPDDVVKCLDRLYRQRRVGLSHARILRIYGERGCAPDPFRRIEQDDARLWREAMDRMGEAMRLRKLVR